MSQETGIASNFGNGPEIRQYTITHDDLTAAATTQVITLFTLPKGGVIIGVKIKHSASFTGGGLGSMTVSVGDTVGPTVDAYAAAFNIFQAAADTTMQLTNEFKATTHVADAVKANFTGDANVSVATAGSVDITVFFWNITTPL